MPLINHFKFKKWLHLLIPLFFVTWILCITPIQHSFEFDPDEGMELIKAHLYSQGFELYTQIWNDQPPLCTIFLSDYFSLFGESIFTARLGTLLFSALLVWSLYQILDIERGTLSAIVGTLLLVTSNKFLQLSVSVMMGIPSLSLAMLSIYTLTLYKKKRHNILLLLSAILISISLQIKAFTIFLIPINIMYLSDFRINKTKLYNQNKKALYSIALWTIFTLVIYLLIGLLFNSLNYEQIVQAHIQKGVKLGFQDYNNFNVIYKMIKKDLVLLSLAIVGTYTIFSSKSDQELFPLIWWLTATLLLLNHHPVWYHHYTLISIPLAWLAGYSVKPVFSFFQDRSSLFRLKPFNIKNYFLPTVTALLIIMSILEVPHKVDGAINAMRIKEPHHDTQVVNILLQYRDSSQWVFTDRPIYAFYAGLSVPPEIAVFSQKRFRSGNLTYDQLLRILQTYRPEHIIISRFKQQIQSHPPLIAYIQKNYSMIYSTDALNYFILRDIQ